MILNAFPTSGIETKCLLSLVALTLLYHLGLTLKFCY